MMLMPKRRWLLLAVAVVALIALLAIYYGAAAAENPGTTKPSMVTVTGLIKLTGAEIAYERVNFTSLRDNTTYSAQVFSEAYNISLPNRDSYKVTIIAHFIGYPTGRPYAAGTLDLYTNETSLTRDWGSGLL